MDSPLLQASLLFAGSAALVIFCGIYLAKYGDALAELMGWGRLWVGTILVAVATSLPELVTNITAVSRDDPGLAVGNIFGANMVNMFALSSVALVFGGAQFFRRVSPEQKYLVLVAMALTGSAILLGTARAGLSIFDIGLPAVLILAVYLGGMRLVYVTRPQEAENDESASELPSLRKAWTMFGLASLGVIVAAIALTFSAQSIADETGVSSSFLGVIAVALVTTMPEATTTIAAVRLRAVDLAVGNLYGSCAFNVLILAVADPFYRGGVLVESFENVHRAAGLFAISLMGLGLVQILLRGEQRFVPIKPTLALMCIGYVVGLLVVFRLS